MELGPPLKTKIVLFGSILDNNKMFLGRFLTKIVVFGPILDLKQGYLTPKYDANWYESIVGWSGNTRNTLITAILNEKYLAIFRAEMKVQRSRQGKKYLNS